MTSSKDVNTDAKQTEGANLPCPMEMIVCQVTPARCPNSCWVSLHSWRASLSRLERIVPDRS
jgi:hypothetical protein